jgi:polynucleotide 5'-hydroxyl-kinase GRC3/NOL9
MSSAAPLIRPGPGWEEIVPDLLGATVLALGVPGVGKSSCVRYLAWRLAETHRAEAPARGLSPRVGLVNADMGQASFGLPGCLGLSLQPPWEQPAALWFVGANNPVGNMLQTVVGTARLAQRARADGAGTVLIDPTGLATGDVGRILKYHKAVAAGVDRVVALQRDTELEPLLNVLAGVCCVIHRLRPVPEAYDRTWEERRAYRQTRFGAHLAGGTVVRFPPHKLLTRDLAPGPLPPGEAGAGPGTLVGLLDGCGYCLALGLLEEVQLDRVEVYTAWRDADAVAHVQLGRLRLTRDGLEVPRVPPTPSAAPTTG